MSATHYRTRTIGPQGWAVIVAAMLLLAFTMAVH